jgi:hypothetical protein
MNPPPAPVAAATVYRPRIPEAPPRTTRFSFEGIRDGAAGLIHAGAPPLRSSTSRGLRVEPRITWRAGSAAGLFRRSIARASRSDGVRATVTSPRRASGHALRAATVLFSNSYLDETSHVVVRLRPGEFRLNDRACPHHGCRAEFPLYAKAAPNANGLRGRSASVRATRSSRDASPWREGDGPTLLPAATVVAREIRDRQDPARPDLEARRRVCRTSTPGSTT